MEKKRKIMIQNMKEKDLGLEKQKTKNNAKIRNPVMKKTNEKRSSTVNSK